MRKTLKITIVLALLAVPATALAAAPTNQPWAIKCQQLKYKPKSITLSCGDGATWLGKLKWSSWSGSKAVASGNFTANDCKPSCVAGQTHSVAMTVTLSKPKLCSGQVERAFKQAAITYKGTRPRGAPTKVNFRCPDTLPQGY